MPPKIRQKELRDIASGKQRTLAGFFTTTPAMSTKAGEEYSTKLLEYYRYISLPGTNIPDSNNESDQQGLEKSSPSSFPVGRYLRQINRETFLSNGNDGISRSV